MPRESCHGDRYPDGVFPPTTEDEQGMARIVGELMKWTRITIHGLNRARVRQQLTGRQGGSIVAGHGPRPRVQTIELGRGCGLMVRQVRVEQLPADLGVTRGTLDGAGQRMRGL